MVAGCYGVRARGGCSMRRPRVKLDHLIAFLAVARHRNLDAAASELGLSVSGVRKQLDAE